MTGYTRSLSGLYQRAWGGVSANSGRQLLAFEFSQHARMTTFTSEDSFLDAVGREKRTRKGKTRPATSPFPTPAQYANPHRPVVRGTRRPCARVLVALRAYGAVPLQPIRARGRCGRRGSRARPGEGWGWGYG